MKSPFPGMDPWLERYWRDVHHGFTVYARDQLQPKLPSDLRARVEQRTFIESDDPEYRVEFPDVSVVERRRSPGAAPSVEGEVALDAPLVLHLDDEPFTQAYIEIVDAASGERVVTVIELLSPANKVSGEGQEKYLQKQRECLASSVNLVEIDLTRAGRRVLSVPPERIPPPYRTTYQVCVRRGARPGVAEIYAVPLDRRLPTIGIPLRPADPDVAMELQPIIEQCYRNGRYAETLDYRADAAPPLEGEEARWAEELLRSKGLR